MRIDSIDRGSILSDHLSNKNAAMHRDLATLAEVDLTKMSKIEQRDVREKCEEVETLFVKMLLDQVRKSMKKESTGSNALDQGRDIYQEMLYDEYAKSITKNSGVGIADLIFNQITTPKISAAEAIARYTK